MSYPMLLRFFCRWNWNTLPVYSLPPLSLFLHLLMILFVILFENIIYYGFSLSRSRSLSLSLSFSLSLSLSLSFSKIKMKNTFQFYFQFDFSNFQFDIYSFVVVYKCLFRAIKWRFCLYHIDAIKLLGSNIIIVIFLPCLSFCKRLV